VADDPSNRDPAYARSRVRHGLLAALRGVHPGAERHVAALADVLRDEGELIAPIVAAARERARAGGGGLGVAELLAEPPAMRRLLVREEIAAAGLPADAAGGAAVARVLDLLERGGRASLPGGGEAAVERGRLVIRARPPEAPAPVPLPVPGRARFGDAGVSARPGRGAPPAPGRVALAVEGPLLVRPPRPGDRLRLPGGGRQAVGRLLAAAGVPAWRRPAVPVVAAGDRVVWVAGHRADPALLAPVGAPAVVLELTAAA
jgi:tRNA(Ile)-lysidine synthase